MLQIIYPPNKPITALNCQKVLELADEYQISELNKRCRQFLMQQRGKIKEKKLNANNHVNKKKEPLKFFFLPRSTDLMM